MPRRGPDPSVKDRNVYEVLRDEDNSREKSARIANASAASSRRGGRQGGSSGSYDDWTVAQLRKRAAELELDGRSSTTKSQLVDALRQH